MVVEADVAEDFARVTYSDKEMKTLILELAQSAEPLEADALRSIAKNYETTQEPEDTGLELSFRQILLMAAAVYAIWTPLSFWLEARYVAEDGPAGRKVEPLSGFTQTADGRYTTRTYKFARGEVFVDGARRWTFSEDAVPLVVYEEKTPLPKDNYEFQQLHPQNIWRFVTIKPSDGSDPSKNGRRYYVVLP
jgi:hypothetical protein